MSNTGLKIVTRLRKFVDGNPTDETKVNVVGDPDYVAPFIDESLCDTGSAAPTPVPAAPVPQPVPVAPTPTYKTFSISNTDYSDTSAACAASATYVNNYHEANSTLPVIGTKIYTDTALSTTVSEGIYLIDGYANKAVNVGSNGRISSITNCVAPTPSPAPSPVALAPAPTFNYYFVRECVGNKDRVIKTSKTFTIGNDKNSSTTVSIFGSCFYAYNTATEGDYLKRRGDLEPADVTYYQMFNGCYECTGGGQGVPSPTPGPTPQPVPSPAPIAPVALGRPVQIVSMLWQSAFVATPGNIISSFDSMCRTSPLQTIYLFGSYPGVGAYVTKNASDPKGTEFDANGTNYRVVRLPDGRGIAIRQSDGYIAHVYSSSVFCS